MPDNVTSLFRSTAAHSPSMAALTRESDGAGPVDFCIPCNPYFPTPAMFDEMAARLRDIITYYPSSADTITAELCSLLRLPPQCVAMGNGSTELITWIDHLLVRESLAVPVPTFGRWTDQPMETGKRVDMFPLQESSGFALDLAQYAEFIRARGTRVAVVCNPNNPDGGFLHKHAVVQFMDAMADLDLVVIDESFLEFADAENEPSVVQEAMLRPNVIVLRSLGKNFGLHGIRFGYLVANPALAGRVRSMLPKWNLNSFAEYVVFMLKEHGAEYARSLHQVRRDRMDMSGQLSSLPGLTVYPSQGNFLFVRLPVGAEGTVVRDRLLTEHRILVRECGNKIGSSSRFLRLVVRPQVDVRRLVSGLEQVLYGTSRRGAAVPEQATGTGYSSGTAAVDRLVSETNGAGTHGLAQAAGAGMPLPAAASAPAVGAGGGMPVPAAAGLPQPEPRPVVQEAPRPQPVPQPAPQPVPQPVPQQLPPPVPFPEPAGQPAPVAPPLAPAAAVFPTSAPMPAPMPMPATTPMPATMQAPAPMQAPMPPAGPTPPGVPARGGLTAAQVRGTDGLSMAPATGWPGAQSWPEAAGMGQAG
ncbi:histidinol-phosphate aminotransferase family protein [Streptomyces sp. RO-S4]|uniref:pyridoxal phosphate-dependent aminotransferase n=1 Tax=unclassified Streptomyces TaxID=2593676 RepID=UPI001E5F0500|nr:MULTISPECIES: histidinol-phosphate transaminase [unclassified Streptomyces]MCO4695887.1 histidinol-phosphate aminotransferase family protein [Streptomyces sp. RO-S4]MDU0304659.1 histidinol-phosphate transaminase [Streptomyces sp. PAL114]